MEGVREGEKPPYNDKAQSPDRSSSESMGAAEVGGHLNATEDDILEAREYAATLSVEHVRTMMTKVYSIHEGDPNFPFETLQKVRTFLSLSEAEQLSEKNEQLVEEVKIEAAMMTTNSPYAEVRATVDNTDDPTLHVSTVRAWTIGVVFCVILAFVNQLFSIRLPVIKINAIVGQLLAYPLGKAWEKWMPAWSFRIPFVKEHVSLNPGRFNKKEHMLIAIMAGISTSLPFSFNIFWVQIIYFKQEYAKNFGYMFVNTMATNFIGYGLAGVLRRFIVYPSYCIWPLALVAFALNSALHQDTNPPVPGPFRKTFRASRYKWFMITFAAMFVYFWLPNYLFTALSFFTWMTWIAPTNKHLDLWTGMQNGLGLFNPVPTFDWNILSFMADPLMVPSFAVFNVAGGMWLTGFVVAALYYTNTWNMGYIPPITNLIYDHFQLPYNVTAILDPKGMYDEEKYVVYSAPYISAGQAVQYAVCFTMYTAVIMHVVLYHRHEMMLGWKGLWKSIRRQKPRPGEDEEYMDIHMRLMQAYPEVSELWYLGILVISIVLGVIGIACWPTYTSPATCLFGVLLCVIFFIPIGIVDAMTGYEVPLTVLAEFLGGFITEGNALALNFFKTYGYVTCSHAVLFASDLKVAHYAKIPPRVTFAGQMVATLISTIVCVGVMNIQINIDGVCTPEAPMRLFCPQPTSFFTAAVLWGTIGPKKMFGDGGQYPWLLMGFPIGIALVLIVWGFKKSFPNVGFLRKIHVVAALAGGTQWAPYSFSYIAAAVPVAWFSWVFIRNRFLGFWGKYNYVTSAAFQCGVAISAIIMLFSVQWVGINIKWWGNTVAYSGCENTTTPCVFQTLTPGDRFYPWWDGKKIPAP